MKVPFSWLKEYVDIDISAQELETKLFSCGFEVEELIPLSAGIHKVVVGVVTAMELQEGTHLHKCVVDCGEYGHEVRISTGASNVFVGAHVPTALDGSTLPGGITIKKRVMQGVESNGMLCSGEELEDERLLLDFKISKGKGNLSGASSVSHPVSEIRQIAFHRVAITTGGHPKIENFKHLSDLGHAIEQPIPSLFTFNIADKAFKNLMGTVVDPVYTSIPGTKLKAEGPLLITHWGMSGPAVLKLSSHAARHLHENNYQIKISVNWVHESNRSLVEENIQGIIIANPQKQLASIRPYNLPSRLWLFLIQKMGYAPEKKWSEMGKKGCNLLIETLTNDLYQVNGKGAFKEEFVTCGGISLSNIDLHTLESKVCPHLFFAGEVLDIDAITGGFNLQAAWTTGYVVGQHIGE